ncbi:MAG: cysteine desulfurase-like protein [Pseudomonadota bacterium]
MTFDVEAVRAQFPALSLSDNGKPRVYLDGPAGTQVPQCVIDAMTDCMIGANANLGGDFVTSIGAQNAVDSARQAMADLLGAPDPDSIVLGANMTSLTKQISQAICSTLTPGETIILSRMDHDANVSPWLDMAKQYGLEVKWLDIDPQTFQLNLSMLEHDLKAGAKVVAVGYASNVLGTINPVEEICALARKYGALSYVDAVHYAPHGSIDVMQIGCDLLVCSVYKFFGPHCSGMYIRPDILSDLPAHPLRPAPQTGPVKYESGTMNHEGIAGSAAAIDYIASLGRSDASSTRRASLVEAFKQISDYETELCWQLIDGLTDIAGVHVQGITNPAAASRRAPTVSFTHDQKKPQEIAAALSQENIFSWAGHSYAIEPLGQLGLLETGGVLRLGIAHYNTGAEIDRTLDVLKGFLA